VDEPLLVLYNFKQMNYDTGESYWIKEFSMAVQPITLNLPDAIYHRLQHVANALNRPLEEVIFQSIQGNLPPAVDDLPSELRHELLTLQTMTDQALWAITKAELPPLQWSRHQVLLKKKQAGMLNPVEESELTVLRDTVDHFVMRRSYAMALLKWRGHSLAPLLVPTN